MSDQEMLKAIRSDDTDQIMLAALRNRLDAELEKPASEWDVDKINQITATMDIITGSEQITAEKTQQGIHKLKQMMRQQKSRKIVRHLRWAAVCACVLLAVSNIWSYSVHGISVFSAAYQMINGGITIDFDKDNSEPAAGNPYEEEMRESCLEHDFGGDVLIPTYLPEGFTPTENYGHFDADSSSKTIFFLFKRGKAKLNLDIIQYTSEKDMTPYGIPSTEYNISPQVIGDTTVHISKETKDQQYWALFRIGSTQYVLYAEKLDYDECQRVLESMFENNQ